VNRRTFPWLFLDIAEGPPSSSIEGLPDRSPRGQPLAAGICRTGGVRASVDLEGAVREVARVLEPAGRFCLAIVHPMNSAGRFEGKGSDAPFRMDGSSPGREHPSRLFVRMPLVQIVRDGVGQLATPHGYLGGIPLVLPQGLEQKRKEVEVYVRGEACDVSVVVDGDA